MSYPEITVEELCRMTKHSYDTMFNKHVASFYKEIMSASKLGEYKASLYPSSYMHDCYEPLDVVFDAVNHIKKLFKGIRIYYNTDDHIICDGYYFEAFWKYIDPSLLEDCYGYHRQGIPSRPYGEFAEDVNCDTAVEAEARAAAKAAAKDAAKAAKAEAVAVPEPVLPELTPVTLYDGQT